MSDYERIWTQIPELQNFLSSSWWFFVMLPKTKTGYGPEQFMFSFASRVGKQIAVNKQKQPGFSSRRKQKDGMDEFMTTAVGWIYDGSKMHHKIVHQPIKATLQPGSLGGWHEEGDKKYGAEIRAKDEETSAMEALFIGKRGGAEFEVWQTNDNGYEGLKSSNYAFPLGLSVQTVASRNMYFKGKFTLPDGRVLEREGLCYFQRVLMNIPMFPWFWNYICFDNGSILSGFQPYLGLQLFRKRTYFFAPRIERRIKTLFKEAYFNDAEKGTLTIFKRAKINPTFPKASEHPHFEVTAYNDDDNYINVTLRANGKTQFLLDTRMGPLRRSRFNYNEFMTQVIKVEGKINGEAITHQQLGPGWGNMEYTWGYSF